MELRARGVGAAAVQAGDDGDLIVHAGGEVWLPRKPIHGLDATGAGDAFAAALAVGLAEGRDWDEAGLFASTAVALATQAIVPREQVVCTAGVARPVSLR